MQALARACIVFCEVMEMKRHVPALSGPAAGLLLLALLLRAPDAAAGARQALVQCGASLVPSLLPCCVAANLLLGAAKPALPRPAARWLGLSPVGLECLLVGAVSGFPLGAMYAAAQCKKGRMQPGEAVVTAALANQAGPAFVLGAVGLGVFGSARTGAALWAGVLVSAVLCARLLAPGSAAAPQAAPPAQAAGRSLLRALPQAVGQAGAAMVRLCAMVVFFGALLGAATPLLPTAGTLARAVAGGLLELSSGVSALGGLSRRMAAAAGLLLLGWGGCCVHLQALGPLAEAGLSFRVYLGCKGLQAAVCALLAAPLGLPPRLAWPVWAGEIFVLGVVIPKFRGGKSGNLCYNRQKSNTVEVRHAVS